jgi:hypothetical protein
LLYFYFIIYHAYLDMLLLTSYLALATAVIPNHPTCIAYLALIYDEKITSLFDLSTLETIEEDLSMIKQSLLRFKKESKAVASGSLGTFEMPGFFRDIAFDLPCAFCELPLDLSNFCIAACTGPRPHILRKSGVLFF